MCLCVFVHIFYMHMYVWILVIHTADMHTFKCLVCMHTYMHCTGIYNFSISCVYLYCTYVICIYIDMYQIRKFFLCTWFLWYAVLPKYCCATVAQQALLTDNQ